MNTLLTKIEEKLQQSGVAYKLIPLPEDLPLDVASHVMFHKITFADAIPTLLYRTEHGLVAIQRRADTKLNIEKTKKYLGVNQLDFANEKDLQELGTSTGIVPLVGLDIPHYLDKKVLERGVVYGGSGDTLFAISVEAKHLVKLNNAAIGDFTDEPKARKKVYSGMRATGSGRLHLGNYLGGAKGMLALQDEYDCIFSVVDAHAVTTPYDPALLREQVRNVILDYLAVGLDPQKCKLEIQSQIPQHTELAYYLSSVYPLAPLEDLPTFKEKKAQYPKNVTVALLNYPILMAADILLYKAELVPVGIDQEPHLEVAREIARKFNQLYGETFPEPTRFKTRGEYVPSLLGQGKMSKTVEGSAIYLEDDFETIKKKLAKVPTDSGTTGGSVPKEGGVASLFAYLALFNKNDIHKKYKEDYENGRIRYGELKQYLAEAIYEELKPVQEKRKYYEEHPEIVNGILSTSREQCLVAASNTMNEVKEKMGLPL